MWPSEPGVGRFGLPPDFGPPQPQDKSFMDPQWMIYDEDYCHMLPGIAQRNPSPTSPGAINEAATASHTLCNSLRHGDHGRIQPFNEG
eukprot:4001240-Heterocapsa_arctica.AAC.1